MNSSSNTRTIKDQLNGPSHIDPEELLFLSLKEQRGTSTFSLLNTKTERFIFIDFLEEMPAHALTALWENDRYLGRLPILKTSIDDRTLETITASVWNEFHSADYCLAMLNLKRVSEAVRYQSPLNMVAEIAASLTVKSAVHFYVDRRQREGDKTIQVPEWDNSYSIPEFLLPTYTWVRLSFLDLFNRDPEEAEAVYNDYWRITVAAALRDLGREGYALSALPRRKFKRLLNKYIWENKDFDGCVEAAQFCGRLLAKDMLDAVDFTNLSIKKMEEFLNIRKKSSRKEQAKSSLLIFENEPILPFGEVEELIRMNWQCPGESDLEIIRGGSSEAELGISYPEMIELVQSAIQWWREKENELQVVREKLDDPQICYSYMHRIFHERRHFRRYMRSRYGIDMARRRVLRSATLPQNAKEAARRAFYYANTLALEAAAEAAVFTFDWFKTKFSEDGNESSEEALTKAVQRAARAAVGVMEALPLFHQAIMEKASHPAVREVELYVISGFAGTHISLRRFPRLSRAVTRKQMLELLPEAVTTALNQRRAGEPLIRGRNSIRNRVARFLESWNKQPPRQENLYSPDLLEKASRESPANNQPQMEIEDFELLQEARAKLAEKLAQSDLSPRERSVMDLKLQGHSQNEIASKLNITVGSVKRLQARAYKKLRS